VDDALLVGGLEAAGELAAEAEDILFGERSGAQRCFERWPGDELHDQEVDAVLGVEVVDAGPAFLGAFL